ncbi:hypothetical protein CSW98_01595 [Vibrio sp. HA2012]|uniref:hypothetical protein n=1 Tax=Vibrio sp. HA2012 TaxID=1971595 RepID=UPI000C2BACFE|nr:hypothetical protein [Vibrio sp. HA2012]PJC87844.1 hypothetical protein CSW98_01595 [Vibrio sp. HA2012]
MNIAKADYVQHRKKILPLIRQSARKNRHDFADNVDKALLSGRAFLFIAEDGFFVLEPMGKGVVEVVFAFSFGGHACRVYQPVIDQLARDIGADHLYFETTLRGFAVLAKELGYVKQSQRGRVTKWVREVPYGEK